MPQKRESMSELRRDITTGEWVIIATERGRRPEGFSKPELRESSPRAGCPFCPGHESQTPGETYAVRSEGDADGPDWLLRVVPNKFAVVSPESPFDQKHVAGPFPWASGFGYHEVVIESPRHDADLTSMDPGEIHRVLEAYLARAGALRRRPHVRFNLIFRNHGEQAGTSLPHPHSQIVALPLVPSGVRDRLESAARYFGATGRSAYADIFKAESNAGERMIVESNHFVAFEPFASRLPFETWIVPTRHRAAFVDIDSDELLDLARVLGQTLRSLRVVLGDFNYNYVIHSVPCGEERRADFCWHIQILPRLTNAAGFELGTGMEINITLPEDAAARLRAAADHLRGGDSRNTANEASQCSPA
jgi:UDPglucose--hexose-1-phosphate uridylyltransferase